MIIHTFTRHKTGFLYISSTWSLLIVISVLGRGPGSKSVTFVKLHFYYHKTWEKKNKEAKSVLVVKIHLSAEAQDKIQNTKYNLF